jgi:hypothetical protein
MPILPMFVWKSKGIRPTDAQPLQGSMLPQDFRSSTIPSGACVWRATARGGALYPIRIVKVHDAKTHELRSGLAWILWYWYGRSGFVRNVFEIFRRRIP